MGLNVRVSISIQWLFLSIVFIFLELIIDFAVRMMAMVINFSGFDTGIENFCFVLSFKFSWLSSSEVSMHFNLVWSLGSNYHSIRPKFVSLLDCETASVHHTNQKQWKYVILVSITSTILNALLFGLSVSYFSDVTALVYFSKNARLWPFWFTICCGIVYNHWI